MSEQSGHSYRLAMVGGGFDPLHPGHLRLFEFAKHLADKVVVIVESDEYVVKKHPVMLLAWQRADIIKALRTVDEVYLNTNSDGDDSYWIRHLKPDCIIVGPDRFRDEKMLEAEVIELCKIDVLTRHSWRKDFSSSILVAKVAASR